MKAEYLYGFKLENEGDRPYFTYIAENRADLVRFHISPTGYEVEQKWDKDNEKWSMIESHPSGDCELYNLCGNFTKCDDNHSQKCICLRGFVPKELGQWNSGNWSEGCVRRKKLECRGSNNVLKSDDGKRDRFFEIKNIKLPDFADTSYLQNIHECQSKCLDNCSCIAYAFVSGINCLIWSGNLVDMQQFKEGGNSLYVRLDNSEFGKMCTKIFCRYSYNHFRCSHYKLC